MLFKDEAPNYLVEFAKNKMLITGYPSHNYIVHDWEAVSVLQNPEPQNFNYFAMVMPDFDEVDFPFIALCGE